MKEVKLFFLFLITIHENEVTHADYAKYCDVRDDQVKTEQLCICYERKKGKWYFEIK